jgi:hypothetical protein
MHFLNIHHCHESAGRLARALHGAPPQETDLHESYRTAISKIRPVGVSGSSVNVTFEDGEWGRYLLENNTFENIFIGIRDSDQPTRDQWANHVEDALQYIRDLNPDLGRIVDLLVTDVVVLDSDRNGGGSASHIPGLVCISPGPNWRMVDFAESIVHEATHLNLFVADMMHGIYTLPTSALAESKYRVLSAVKIGELRPLDKAFHSAAVAVPLMYMQFVRGETTLVDQFTTSLLDCSTGLMDKRSIFTPYGRMLVEELHAFALSTDFSYVVRSLSSPEYASY